MTAIANHAKMMGTDSRRIVRADERPTVAQLMVAHAFFSLQKVNALASCVIFSALTTPSTRMRQPMLSLSPCATILSTAVAAVVANVNDHGKRAPSTSLRVSIDVEIADGGHRPRGAEDLVRQVLGVERRGVVELGVGIRGAVSQSRKRRAAATQSILQHRSPPI